MYALGKDITACDQVKEIEKQATLMCGLGKEYADLAEQTGEGWHFNYATALFNAALQRLMKCQAEHKVNLFDRVEFIHNQLQQLETNFLKAVCKENKESLTDCMKRYKSILKDIRKYSTETIENIHTEDMIFDNETFEMSKETQIRTIANSKTYYETLTDKIIDLHALMINDCISVLGHPDCKFSILGLGSLSRKEVTAWSDLESAVLYDATGKTEGEIELLKRDFRILVHYFHMKVINLGETLINGLDIPVLNDWNSRLPKRFKDNDFWDKITPQGLCFDGTQPKASKIPFGRRSTKNPSKQPSLELIMTPDEMSECQIEQVSLKEGYHLSDVLLTSTLITGDKSLWKEYNDKVHEMLFSRSTIDPNMSVGRKRGLETLREDLQSYLTKPLTPESFNRQMKTKHNIYRFATISINTLKLLHHCKCFAPLDILNELGKKKVLSDRAKTDLQFMVCAATNMRHLVYGRYGQQRELVSFVNRPSKEELIGALDTMSVRDYAPVIFRFYATLTSWTDFLLYNFCFNDISTCTHASQYADSNSEVTAKVQEKMYMFQSAINSLERQRSKLPLNNAESKKKFRDIQLHLSQLFISQGKFNESIRQIEKDASEENEDTSSTLNTLATAHFHKGELDKAIKYYNESLAMLRTIHGKNPHPDIASALGNLGFAYDSKGKFDKAIRYHKESLEMQQIIHGICPHPNIAATLGNLGSTYDSKGEFDKAIQYHKKGLVMLRSINGNHPHPEVATSLLNLGNTHTRKGEFDEAIQLYKECLTMQKTIHGDNPHPDIASSLSNLGSAYKSKGEFDKSIQYHNKSLAMERTIHGNNPHPNIASTLGSLGCAYESKGEFDKAIQYHKDCLIMQRTVHGDNPHPDVASTLGNLGNAYRSKGEFDKAIRYLKESLKTQRTIHGNQPHPDIATSLGNLGSAYDSKIKFDEAIRYHEDSLAMKRIIHGNRPHPGIASSLLNLGNTYCKKGDHTQGLQCYTQCLIMQKKIYGDQPHTDMAGVLGNMGNICSETGDNDNALKYYYESLAMQRKIFGNHPHPIIASTFHNIGNVYVATHRYAEALMYFYEARDMLKLIFGDNPHPDFQTVLQAINSTEEILTRCMFAAMLV
ncbi:unnamed protein product [Owenia fusiformis]|uniref:Uncharacterized protein n=1 Tax=Owenia fusiformis TaxID=6347 RepID=A0A8J1YBY3_OWEFU|nr:unnamed protein product [Owenia fusiformis]